MGRKRDGVFLVFEYCQHDMANLIDNMGSKSFSESEIKSFMTQVRALFPWVVRVRRERERGASWGERVGLGAPDRRPHSLPPVPCPPPGGACGGGCGRG